MEKLTVIFMFCSVLSVHTPIKEMKKNYYVE